MEGRDVSPFRGGCRPVPRLPRLCKTFITEGERDEDICLSWTHFCVSLFGLSTHSGFYYSNSPHHDTFLGGTSRESEFHICLETNTNVLRQKSHNVMLSVPALLDRTLPPSPNLAGRRLDVDVSGDRPNLLFPDVGADSHSCRRSGSGGWTSGRISVIFHVASWQKKGT